MKRSLLILLATCFTLQAASLPLPTGAEAARQALQDGKPDEALAALADEGESAEVHYWKGRALAELGRLAQAAAQFDKVPADSVFYPYAAKGLLYCAWQSPSLNFVELVAPLTASPDKEISTLALAALAEHQLRNTAKGDASTLEDLRKLAKKEASLQPVVQLLDMENLRRNGQWQQAIAACLKAEADKSLPLLMRQRVRLTLAEIYYDKAAAPPATPAQGEDEPEDDEGKGEETLLQFISSNPDSPLLEEAFRRLDLHHAFGRSEYATQKLKEWSEELAKPRRAALALLVRQHLGSKEDRFPKEAQDFANTASSLLAHEPASKLIISEYVRQLIAEGNTADARYYLSLAEPDAGDARALFYKACCLKPTDPKAAALFLESAARAASDLQAAALGNAMYCSVLNGDRETVDSLLTRELPPKARRAVLLMHAGLILRTNPPQARAEIESALLLHPDENQQAEVPLLLAQIDLAEHDPQTAFDRLQNLPEELKKRWTDGQALRYYGLLLLAGEHLHAKDATAPTPEGLTRECLDKEPRAAVRTILTLNLAERLSDKGKREEALSLLEALAARQPQGTDKARSLLLAGREAAALGSLHGLKKAIAYFRDCAAIPSPYSHRASIVQAAIQAWINQTDQALPLLQSLLKRPQELTPADHALALSVLADIYSMQGTQEGQREALAANERIRQIEGLPQGWKMRATLQHATLAARAGQHGQALADYLEIIGGRPASSPSPHPAEWYVLYYAGAGAIYQYMELQRYEEAATLAETLAAWPGEEGVAPGPRARQFAQWGASIRQTHFLPHVTGKGNSKAADKARVSANHTR